MILLLVANVIGGRDSRSDITAIGKVRMRHIYIYIYSRGGAMVSTSARNAGDPWFESRSWYDRFLYVNIHLFIYIYIYIYIHTHTVETK